MVDIAGNCITQSLRIVHYFLSIDISVKSVAASLQDRHFVDPGVLRQSAVASI
jgi:hypothetical protein